MRPDDPTFLTREDHRLPGVKRLLQVPAPAAGADWSVSVPGGRQWRVLSGLETFTTSAVVANRFHALQVIKNGAVVWSVGWTAAIAAGNQFNFTFSRDLGAPAAGASGIGVGLPFAGWWLDPGSVIASFTSGLAAGDQFSNIALAIEECYADDTQLSEAHLEREAEERTIAEQAHAILIGG